MCCCSTRIVQIGGGAPFNFSVTAGNSPYNGGLGVITGPIAINSGDIVHFYSANTIDFDVVPGSANVHAEVRLDPNPLNTLSASAAGLMATGGGGPSVNIYNSDGTITDPTRTVTVGTSTLDFNSLLPGVADSGIHTEAQVNSMFTHDIVADLQNTVTADIGSVVLESNSAPADAVARNIVNVAGSNAKIRNSTNSSTWQIQLEQVSELGVSSYWDFQQLGSTPYFEIRLDGNPGNPGEVLTSQGPGVSPIWTPVTVTANSLDNLFFTTDIDWDFGGNDWNVTNVDNINFTSNTFTVNSPVVCFPNIGQNDALTRFLVQDPGGCLSWRDGSTIGGGIYSGSGNLSGNTVVNGGTFDLSFTNINNLVLDAACIQLPAPRAIVDPVLNGMQRALVIDPITGCLAEQAMDQDWLTIQTITPELFASNNAYRLGGIGIIGTPHATTAPFDTNNLIFDIEVAGGQRNTIGVNTLYGALGTQEGSFQLLAPATGGTIAWSAISIGASVDTGFGTVPALVGPFASPASDNLIISHKSTTGGGGGDVPIVMLYGAGNTNSRAGIILSDVSSVNNFSVPSELVTVGSVSRTPRIHIHNDNIVGNDEASLLISTDGLNSRMALGVGEFLDGAGNFVSAGDPNIAFWSFSGPGTTRPFITLNKVGGVAITNQGPQTATAQDLLVDGQYSLVTFADYPSTRDDSGSFAPVNFLYTNLGGDILSAPVGNILCNISSLPCAPVWDFNNNSFTWNNVDQFSLNGDTVDINVNNFTVNSPSVCFPAITQNNTLTRVLVVDNAGGCMQWRDVSTIGGGGPIPINSLLAATGTNAIDNDNFNQTWEWNSLTTGVGLQLESSSITTGSLLQLDTNVSGARVGRLVNVLSTNSTTGFRGIQVTTNDTSTEGVNITQTGIGRALRVETANAGPIGSGAPLIEFERTNAASDGETIQRNLSLGNDTGLLVSTAATSAIVASFSGNSLTSGQILRATSTSAFSGAVMQAIATGQHTGQVFDVQSRLSTQAFANGGARFFFGGNHTGSSVLIDSGTTAGNALEIISAVNSGTALKIDATSLNTGEAIDIDAGTTDGNVYIRFSESGVTQGTITNGPGNTVLYNTTSDRNLKENIQDTDMLATDLIESIEVVEFNFKSDKDKNILHGLIAQDLYEVYPEAVTKGIGKSPWSIDYSKLVPVLLRSIQELSARIDELENNL